jgi:hypothetical protein
LPRKEVIFAISVLSASAVFADEHPKYYIDKGACPFECCTYREWSTDKTTELHKEPKIGSSVIGTAKKGLMVTAKTGEVHTRPGKLIVRKDVTTFRKGDVLWVYTYLGESYFKIWYQGKFIEDQIDFNIRKPKADDWGYFEIIPDSDWWVRIKTHSGLEGWTNKPGNFSNQDACG